MPDRELLIVPDVRPQTRAFLFADLRGYSAYTERHGDRAAEALIGRYRQLVRTHISAFGGAEIRTEGDSFYVVFDSVAEAVEAALAISHAARAASDDGPPIPVGIGVHAGESRDGEHGIVSSAVNIAARVCAVAGPGEVLVTETVRGLTRTALPVGFTPRGRRRLKGISEPIALFRVDGTAEISTRPRRGLGLVPVAGIVVGLVVVMVLAVTRGGTGTAERRSASTGADVSPAQTEDPQATRDLSRFTDPGEFPNAAETALLDRLLSRVGERCERADPADTPIFRFSADEGFPQTTYPLRTRAGLDCLVDGIRVQYWQASGSGAQQAHIGFATDLFLNKVRRLSLTEGDCAEASRVYGQWEAGAHDGMVLCYATADEAVVHWTFDKENIYAIARDRSASLTAVYRWWIDAGRLLSR